jgi:hypothetical protein
MCDDIKSFTMRNQSKESNSTESIDMNVVSGRKSGTTLDITKEIANHRKIGETGLPQMTFAFGQQDFDYLGEIYIGLSGFLWLVHARFNFRICPQF